MSAPLPIDPGLWVRMQRAFAEIAWDRPWPTGATVRRTGRIATLHDETARVERWGTVSSGGLAVTSGPVGALVVLVEFGQRGVPGLIGGLNAGRDPHFPDGAIVAVWGAADVRTDARPTLKDLIDLARYALP